MRYVSQLFQPVITIPKNARIKNTEITCKSQKLLLECGLVRPTSSGFFTLLPLARRALDKLEHLIRTCMEAAGAQRMSLPALTSAGLWEKTGRLKDVGPELMKLEDRHGKKYLLAPTHEEAVADLLADVGPLSYKQLPLLLYQISNKYRDEQRPKHGVMRAREFCMMDAYGAHGAHGAHSDEGGELYERVSRAYRDLFSRLHLTVHRVQAPPGDMGGSLSHEWQLPAGAGEDIIRVCPSCSHADTMVHDGASECARCATEMEHVTSIEVGHTFMLGTKYSEPLQAHFVPHSGPQQPLAMSCYGIGVTRLLAASLEALSSDTALRWATHIAPYNTIIIGPKDGSKECSSGAGGLDRLKEELSGDDDVLVDDRNHLTIGKRLMMADRMGYPTIIVCGRSTLDSPPRYEVYRSAPHTTLSVQLLTLQELMQLLSENNTFTTIKNDNVTSDNFKCTMENARKV